MVAVLVFVVMFNLLVKRERSEKIERFVATNQRTGTYAFDPQQARAKPGSPPVGHCTVLYAPSTNTANNSPMVDPYSSTTHKMPTGCWKMRSPYDATGGTAYARRRNEQRNESHCLMHVGGGGGGGAEKFVTGGALFVKGGSEPGCYMCPRNPTYKTWTSGGTAVFHPVIGGGHDSGICTSTAHPPPPKK